MKLRKCPGCKDIVGADSEECPRCGVNFRSATVRRLLKWTIVLALIAWGVCHFIFKKV